MPATERTGDPITVQPRNFADDDDITVEYVDLAATEVMVDGERLTDERADAIAADVLVQVRAAHDS